MVATEKQLVRQMKSERIARQKRFATLRRTGGALQSAHERKISQKWMRELRLWRDAQFVEQYELLSLAGYCDGLGGMESRRVYLEWILVGFPPVAEFIKRRANAGPDDFYPDVEACPTADVVWKRIELAMKRKQKVG